MGSVRPEAGPTAEEQGFRGLPCYEFNPRLRDDLDDQGCAHCRLYLTTRCPHLPEFLQQIEESEVE